MMTCNGMEKCKIFDLPQMIGFGDIRQYDCILGRLCLDVRKKNTPAHREMTDGMFVGNIEKGTFIFQRQSPHVNEYTE